MTGSPDTDPTTHHRPTGRPGDDRTATADPDLGPLRLCTPLAGDGTVNGRWCQSNRVAVADLRDGRITTWQEFDVGWERLHDSGSREAHHERMAGFLRDHGVNVLVVDHVGSCLRATLLKLDIAVHVDARGPATAAVVAAAREQLTR